MQEYKRKCCNCSNEWLSNVEREIYLEKQAKRNRTIGILGIVGGMLDGSFKDDSAQCNSNIYRLIEELAALRRCNKCGCTTFHCNIVDFELQMKKEQEERDKAIIREKEYEQARRKQLEWIEYEQAKEQAKIISRERRIEKEARIREIKEISRDSSGNYYDENDSMLEKCQVYTYNGSRFWIGLNNRINSDEKVRYEK